MAITRLGTARPNANQAVSLFTFTESYLVSVIAANVNSTTTPIPRVSIFVIPSGAVTETSYSYVAANITLPFGTSFETFRFAVNPGDVLTVRPTTADVAFTAYGIIQDDVVGQGDLPQTFTNKVIRGDFNTLYVESGTTAQRNPASEVGYVRFNTEADTLEVRTSAGWKRVTVTE
jgi:hypothetical protein